MVLQRKGVEISEPRCDGLEGDTFCVVAQKGRQADGVRNIEANRLYESESAVSRARAARTAHLATTRPADDRRSRLVECSFDRLRTT